MLPTSTSSPPCAARKIRFALRKRDALARTGEHDAVVETAEAFDLERDAVVRREPLVRDAGAVQLEKAAGSDGARADDVAGIESRADRKSTRLNSSHLVISYAVF